ncbi:hypothetical protein REPUB_Repub05bG0046500 [Reevesia pubescens]
MESFAILLLCSFLFANLTISTAVDTLNATQLIRDGETIVSAGGRFEPGFFSPGASRKKYLGIWYKQISVKTVVWVANRELPLNDSSGVLKLTKQGILVLPNHSGSTIWSSNSSRPARNPVVQLLDSGNLIVKEENDSNLENFLWQRFDCLCDTLLKGMKLGRNLVTGLDRYLSSWKSPDDPSHGNFTYRFEVGGFPELILREGSVVRFRPRAWNVIVVINEKEVSDSYELHNSSILSRMVLSQEGLWERLTWIDRTQSWQVYVTVKMDSCDNYALCGAYGSCNASNTPKCSCLTGFVPKVQKTWDTKNWSTGCVRKTPLNCSTDPFLKYSGVKLPNSRQSWFNYSMNLEECKKLCTRNCSCKDYSNLDRRNGGSGCLLWFVDLVDIQQFTKNGQEIYIRMAATELGLVTFVPESSFNVKNQKEDLELPLFDLATIVHATDNFSMNNKLGEGGFGAVYKADEKMLIYEFLPNKNLDFFIFDETHSVPLDWPMRYNIINGIARGLLYLHQDSRQRIIHRDLKASNILLDNEMNPKISDFGLARSFGEKETEANTKKVEGTYGYMAPAYAIDGLYSIKYNVFSYGVLVLQIVSGKHIRGFCHPDHQLNLLGHAWRLFAEGKSLELIASTIRDTCNPSEVLRSIHVGLLCVQQSPEDRSSMSNVVLMLGSQGPLPQPKQPSFFTESDLAESSSSSTNHKLLSSNDFTIRMSETR